MFVALKGHHGPVSQQVVSSCQQDWLETLGHALRLGEVAANFVKFTGPLCKFTTMLNPMQILSSAPCRDDLGYWHDSPATMAFPAALAVEQMSLRVKIAKVERRCADASPFD